MTGALRSRVALLLAAFGVLVAAVGYVYGAPASVALLVPAMALVGVLMLLYGIRAAVPAALLAAGAFVFVQLAAVREPLRIDFGNRSASLDLPALFGGAGATWLPAVLGAAALLIMLVVAALLRRELSATRPILRAGASGETRAVRAAPGEIVFGAADRGSPAASAAPGRPGAVAEAASDLVVRSAAGAAADGAEDDDGGLGGTRLSPAAAAFVGLSLGLNPQGKPIPRVTGPRLAAMVDDNLGAWRESAVVWSDKGKVMVLLLGADDSSARALVRRLEHAAGVRFQRSLESAVRAVEAPLPAGEQPSSAAVVVELKGRPEGARVVSPEVRGGS